MGCRVAVVGTWTYQIPRWAPIGPRQSGDAGAFNKQYWTLAFIIPDAHDGIAREGHGLRGRHKIML